VAAAGVRVVIVAFLEPPREEHGGDQAGKGEQGPEKHSNIDPVVLF
jgi:hypothetical protein